MPTAWLRRREHSASDLGLCRARDGELFRVGLRFPTSAPSPPPAAESTFYGIPP